MKRTLYWPESGTDRRLNFFVLIRARLVFFIWLMSVGVEVPGDELLNIVVDQRITLAAVGDFQGAPTNVPSPEVERASNDDLYVKAENLNFYKSTDNGQSWSTQPIDLSPSLTAIGVPASQAHGLNQHLGNFGITNGDRFWLVHQTASQSGQNLFVSHSDDFGSSWTSREIDISSLQPPGTTETYKYAHLVRGPVYETSDRTIQFGVHLAHKSPWHDPWPPSTPVGEALIRSADNGSTWGDASFLRTPDTYTFETDYATDPLNPDHILAVSRPQRQLLPGEDAVALRALTGAPAGASWIYKNGAILESTDAGRTFHDVPGGLLGYYGHRNSIAWTTNGNVVVTSQERNQGQVLARLSTDHGQTWYNGTPDGHPHAGDPSVVEFILHDPTSLSDGNQHRALGMSSTVEVGENQFVTLYGGFMNSGFGIDNGELLGARWHIERVTAPEPPEGLTLMMDLNAGLDSSYPGSGSLWFDISGSGNHAVDAGFVPSLASNHANHRFNMEVFNSGHHFTVPTLSDTLDQTGSVEVWFNSTESTGGSPQNLFGFGGDRRLTINDDKYEWRFIGSKMKPSNPDNTDDALDEVRQLVITHDGVSTYMYLDGELIDSVIDSHWIGDIPSTARDFFIGGLGTNQQPQDGFPGFMHIVRYYNGALSPEQVALNFSAGLLGTNYTGNGGGESGATFSWLRDGSGDWNQSANWSYGTVPNGKTARVVLGDAITSPQTLFTNRDVVVKEITLDSEHRYVISGTGDIHLEADEGDAAVNVVHPSIEGAHEFQTPVDLHSDTFVNVGSGASLVFNNRVNLNGQSLIKTGLGEIFFNNHLASEDGMFFCQEGVCSGTSTISANVVNGGGTISPGNSMGVTPVPEASISYWVVGLTVVGMCIRTRRFVDRSYH